MRKMLAGIALLTLGVPLRARTSPKNQRECGLQSSVEETQGSVLNLHSFQRDREPFKLQTQPLYL